jgi:hypothetical protein
VDKRTLGIILTSVTALFCGCPGIFICLFGGLSAAGLGTYTTDVLGTTGAGTMPAWTGFGLLCLGLFLVVLPIVIGVVMLRKPKTTTPVDVVPPAA